MALRELLGDKISFLFRTDYHGCSLLCHHLIQLTIKHSLQKPSVVSFPGTNDLIGASVWDQVPLERQLFRWLLRFFSPAACERLFQRVQYFHWLSHVTATWLDEIIIQTLFTVPQPTSSLDCVPLRKVSSQKYIFITTGLFSVVLLFFFSQSPKTLTLQRTAKSGSKAQAEWDSGFCCIHAAGASLYVPSTAAARTSEKEVVSHLGAPGAITISATNHHHFSLLKACHTPASVSSRLHCRFILLHRLRHAAW